MTLERYQASAMPIGGGERVTGYLVWEWRWDLKAIKPWIIPADDKGAARYSTTCVGHIEIEIDPFTIEPVRVRPIKMLWDNRLEYFVCPNCREQVDEVDLEIFCGSCGQALDWSKEEAL